MRFTIAYPYDILQKGRWCPLIHTRRNIMQYRVLGKTGLSVSVIGIGALQMGNCTLEEAKAILQEAL